MLVMPANRRDMLAKAPTYGADALVFDLEDAVPVAESKKLVSWRASSSKNTKRITPSMCV